MTNKRGESTGALYGFIRSVQKVIKEFNPDHLVAVFDGPNNKAARTELYADYKGHRKGMPEDFFSQLEHAIYFCRCAGIPYLSEAGVEADDLIGALARWAEQERVEVLIFSSDKDLAQLVSDRVKMVHTHRDNLIVDRRGVETLYGVKPEQIVDYLAIMGDSSDNIPGIPGMGPKTAAALLKEYGSLDQVLHCLDEMPNRKRAEKIRAHRKDAILSRQLAKLIYDVPFAKQWDVYKLGDPDEDALRTLYKDMHFSTLLRELESQAVAHPKVGEKKINYSVVERLDELETLVAHLLEEETVAFDTETTQLAPMRARLVGIGFCATQGVAFYVPVNGKLGIKTVLAKLRPLFESSKIRFVGHNIKYDMHVLLNHDIRLSQIGFDTMLASYLLNPQSRRHSLDFLCLEKFGKVKTSIKDLIGREKKHQKSMAEVSIKQVGLYCCEDVDYTFRLKELLELEIERHLLAFVLYKIEQPLVPVLIAMERTGMYVDCVKLDAISKSVSKEIEQVEREIYDLAGESFNIKSPKQLGEILFTKLQIPSKNKRRTTRADVLERLKKKHPIVLKILTFRALEKLRSTYADALPLQVSQSTGRIHCTLMQTVTATGRLSCQDPNLQNIPVRSEEGRKIREAFCPQTENRRYLSADYSQIELRLLAHMSQDPRLIKAFQNGRDIHTSTAMAVFDVLDRQVTKDMRLQAKVVNFGIIYGQRAFGLSQELNIDLKEASKFIEKYFEKYPRVRVFLEECKDKVRQSGMATTLMNRRRMIPEIHSSNPVIRAAAERLAVNTPLQGSQADIIKIAMIRLHHKLKDDPEVKMVLQVHDELIFELPVGKIPSVRLIVQDVMEHVVSLSVPLKINIEIGKNWGEC